MHLTLADAKRHLNIDAEFSGDDAYITDLIAVGEAAVEQHIDRPFAELEQAGELPAPVLHAIRFIVGQLYANREPAAFASAYKVPYTYDYLIGLYRRYTVV